VLRLRGTEALLGRLVRLLAAEASSQEIEVVTSVEDYGDYLITPPAKNSKAYVQHQGTKMGATPLGVLARPRAL
jgi:hypothetical protein